LTEIKGTHGGGHFLRFNTATASDPALARGFERFEKLAPLVIIRQQNKTVFLSLPEQRGCKSLGIF
jgi:hypothetical protein